jgi:hypothetical protein
VTEKEKLLVRLEKYKFEKDGHWLWVGATSGKRRPALNFKGKSTRVTRLIMWITQDFDLDSELQILHRDDLCNQEGCWIPTHLKIGTHSENMDDRTAKVTHCNKCGKEFTPENTSIRNGTKVCRECHNKRTREWKRKYRKRSS